MRRFAFVMIAALSLAAVPVAAQADEIVRVERGSPLRAALLDAARPTFENEVGGPIEFVVGLLNVSGGWAFGDVKLQRPGGTTIDWSKTKFAEDFAQGMLEPEHNLFLLRLTQGNWQVVEYAIGPTDIAWDWWRQQRGLPAELFGASSADYPPPSPSARPRSGG